MHLQNQIPTGMNQRPLLNQLPLRARIANQKPLVQRISNQLPLQQRISTMAKKMKK